MDLGQDKSSGAYVFFFLILIFSKNFEETYKRPEIIDFNPSFFPFPANINIYKKTNNQNWLYIDIHEEKCNPSQSVRLNSLPSKIPFTSCQI